jgi:hypothetical protein
MKKIEKKLQKFPFIIYIKETQVRFDQYRFFVQRKIFNDMQ